MVKKELKNFELKIEDASYPCLAPCSVKSVLSAAGESLENLGSTVRFETNLQVDDVALSIKYFYLRIRGVRRPAKVFLGDEKICECDGTTPVYTLNLTGRLTKGDNLLSVCFDSADCDLALAGLSESFEVLRFGSAIIDSLSVTQTHEEGSVTLGLNLNLIGNPQSVRAVATLVSASGQIYYAGLTGGKGSIVVRDPLYWWPKGLGVQNLYRLTVNLYGESDVEDSVEMRVGLRSVVTADGNTLNINGSEMIPMGSVYIAEDDPDLSSVDKRVESRITAAAMAGYNCFLIPLSSPTPSERFYQLCDLNGIVVIEEHTVIDGAAVDSLRRRIHHPSLCLIDLKSSENVKIYEMRINDALDGLTCVVKDSLPSYISSPSLPSMKSIRAIIPEGERSLFSRSIEAIAEEGAIKDMLLSVADRYPYPADLSGFAYASALASAHKVGEVIKNSRLTRGKSGRGIFNRLSDSKLAISPSAIDYRGRYKPMQYYTSRYFAPVALYAENQGGVVKFSASNLRRLDLIGSLEYRIADASNYTVFRASTPVEIRAMSEGEIHIADISKVIEGHESEYYLEYYLKEELSTISKKTMLFVPEKHFDFKKAFIDAKITGQDKHFSITLSATHFVKDLELDFDGVDGVFSDNYIDLTAAAPVKISFTVSGAPTIALKLQDALALRSVYDLK
jgi:hypothetical protein